MNASKLNEIAIEEVAKRLGINVRRHSALCPFHDDHHPSFVFNIKKNIWRCYVCDIWGGPIDLVMKTLGLNFKDACRWLEHEFSIESEDISDVLRRVKKPRVKQRTNTMEYAIDVEILEAVVNAAGLGSKARQFLFDERRYSYEVIRCLKVGSINDEKKFIEFLAARFDKERLLKSGIVVKRKGQIKSYFNAPCLLFPYYDVSGKLVNVQARYLGDSDEHPRFQFLRGSKTHVYNIDKVVFVDCITSCSAASSVAGEDTPIYLAEGVTDCIAHLSAGHKAVAIPSATLLKAEDILPLASRRLVMIPDNDIPGQRLYEKVKALLEPTGTCVAKEELPECFKDFSEFYSASVGRHDDVCLNL